MRAVTFRRQAFAVFVVILALVAGAAGLAVGATTAETMFGSTVPTIKAVAESRSVTLGTTLTVKKAGRVTAVRFYKGSGNTGGHVGAIYSNSGALLSRVTFTGETASGWQSANLVTAQSFALGARFTVALLVPNGHYAAANTYSWPRQTASLTATSGVYRYGSGLAYPTSVYQSSTYYIDVSFAPSPVATPTTSPTLSSAPTPMPSTPTPSASNPTSTATSPTAIPAEPTTPTGFPNASNTGVIAGTTLRPSGCITAGTAGQIIENLVITDCDINVTAADVTIRNVRIVTSNADMWAIIIRGGGSATIDHVTIAGKDRTSGSVQYAILSQTSARVTVSHSDLSLCADCIQGENMTVTGNYIHDMANIEGTSHVDGFQCNSSCGVTIIGNTILNEYAQTSAIALFGDFGTPKNSVIRGNLLAGGGYSIYGGVASSTNITIDSNTISKRYYSKGGQYGWIRTGGGNTITGNKFEDGTPAS